ncbi:hypothetical protein VTK26DRAFT_6645 [Humicola hyalothermophila]
MTEKGPRDQREYRASMYRYQLSMAFARTHVTGTGRLIHPGPQHKAEARWPWAVLPQVSHLVSPASALVPLRMLIKAATGPDLLVPDAKQQLPDINLPSFNQQPIHSRSPSKSPPSGPRI